MTASTDHTSRPRLSVAMIVRDEQEVLAESIESVRSIADEIVVLDTGSTDQTLQIAEQLGAVTGRMPWTEDFSAARNRCLELVSGDWVLWLDAGERLVAETAADLREFVDRQAEESKVYMLLVEVPSADPSGSAEQIAQVRLMPRRPELRFTGRVCESVRSSVEAAGLQVDASEGRIVRHRRQHDPARRQQRAHRNLKLVALELVGRADPPAPLLTARGEAFGELNNWEDARSAYRAAVEAAEHGSTEMLEAYYGLLTSYDSDPRLGDRQLTDCIAAMEIFPFDAQLLLAMGNYLQARNEMELATRTFETAVQYGQVDLEAWHLCELAEVANVCLSLTLQLQGKDDRACEVLEEAARLHPNSHRILRRLLDLHVKHGRCEEALELAGQLPAEPEQREPLQDAVRGACRVSHKQWTEALAYLQSAYVMGCRDPLCLRWLAVTLLSRGRLQAAEPVLLEWQKREPNNPEVASYLAAVEQQRAGAAVRLPAAGQPAADAPTRMRLRIDPVPSEPPIAPPQFPNLGQTTSGDLGHRVDK